jgi:hypothetical protein
MTRLIEAATGGKRAAVEIDWKGAQQVFSQATGVPVALSIPVRQAPLA